MDEARPTGAHDQGMGWVTGRQTPPPANDCIFYLKGEDQLRLRRELLAMDVDTTGFVNFAQLAEAMRMCGLPMPDTPRVQAHSLPDERIDYLAYISEVGEQGLTDRRFLDSDPEFISLSGLEPDSGRPAMRPSPACRCDGSGPSAVSQVSRGGRL